MMQKLFFIVSSAILAIGCSKSSGPPIHYIVPDGNLGLIIISPDPNAADIPLIKGTYQVVVPSHGHLKVKSMKPFDRWHSHTAAFASGEPLPQGEVNLHYLSTYSDGASYWLVGTPTEKEMAGHIRLDEIPPGRRLTYDDLPEYAKDRFEAQEHEDENDTGPKKEMSTYK